MSKDNKIRMPSGQGGLTRFYDDYHSKIEFSPSTVVVLAIIVILVVMMLHHFGAIWLGVQ